MRTKYVNNAAGSSVGTQDGSTSTAGSSGTAAFATWDQAMDWIVANDPTLSDDYTIKFRGGNADTAQVTINVTSMNGKTILFQADRAASDGFNNGTALISTAHYRHTRTSGDNVLVNESGITIDGIQLENTASSSFNGCIYPDAGNAGLTVMNCRFRGGGSVRAGITGNASQRTWSGTYNFYNNYFAGFNNSGININPNNFNTATVNILHNTFYMSGSVKAILGEGAGSGTITTVVKNNACANTTAAFSFGAPYSVTYDKNSTDSGGQGTTNEVNHTSTLTNVFTSPGSAQSSQLTVKGTSSPLYNAGATGLGITTDARDQTRDASPDIGADEFVVAGTTYDRDITLTPQVAITDSGAINLSGAITLASVSAMTQGSQLDAVGTAAVAAVFDWILATALTTGQSVELAGVYTVTNAGGFDTTADMSLSTTLAVSMAGTVDKGGSLPLDVVAAITDASILNTSGAVTLPAIPSISAVGNLTSGRSITLPGAVSATFAGGFVSVGDITLSPQLTLSTAQEAAAERSITLATIASITDSAVFTTSASLSLPVVESASLSGNFTTSQSITLPGIASASFVGGFDSVGSITLSSQVAFSASRTLDAAGVITLSMLPTISDASQLNATSGVSLDFTPSEIIAGDQWASFSLNATVRLIIDASVQAPGGPRIHIRTHYRQMAPATVRRLGSNTSSREGANLTSRRKEWINEE